MNDLLPVSDEPDTTGAVVAVYKPVGITSHQVAIRLSRKLKTVVTHTGSLDPVAEGVLVLLIGTTAIRRQAFLQSVDKEYEFDLLFGMGTDTYDQLGLITSEARYDPSQFPHHELARFVKALVGRQKQPIPPYSSKVVKGKPLFWWARKGRLGEVGLPVQEIEIHAAELLGTRTVTKDSLRIRIIKTVSRVEGDFRQEEILKKWDAVLANHPNPSFTLATLRLVCSKGTYVRAIAHRMGVGIGIPAFALRLARTRIGRFRLSDCGRLSNFHDPDSRGIISRDAGRTGGSCPRPAL